MTTSGKYHVGDEPVPGFRLTKFLGSGSFGEVWRAAAPGGTPVAIKINNLGMKGALKEFRALKLIKQIQHPNLVPILALWLKNERGEILEEDAFEQVATDSKLSSVAQRLAETVVYQPKPEPAELTIAMGLGHKSLADRLAECEKLGAQGIPLDELLSYLQDAARALDYLSNPRHGLETELKSIQHCDVKPSNILIVGDAAQVCDFGLAREVGDARATSLAISPVYAAPEVIETNVPSPTTDQYSLAVSYLELRTGQLPFPPGSTAQTVVQAHLQGRLDLSQLRPAEREVIQRATARGPADRYPSCTAMVLALRDACYPRASQLRGVSGPGVAKIGRYAIGDEPVPGYRLSRFLGSGGFGEVWAASAPGGTQVAIKINKLGMKGAFKEFNSLKLVKRIRYPNLVPILALWLKNERGEILEEEAFDQVAPDSQRALDVEGTVISDTAAFEPRPEPAELVVAMGLGEQSLGERLEECKRQGLPGIPLDELLKYLHDAARAVDYLNRSQHELKAGFRSIQHCDIKPSNILIVGDAAQVCDFGLAREVDDASSTSLAISPVYAAPEMIETNVPSPTTDQYSLAITYYELRTGEIPFPADASPHTVVQAHLTGQLDLSRLPAVERKVIERATAREPQERYESAGAMVAALENACHPRSKARTWSWVATLVAGVIVSAVAATWWVRRPGELELPEGFAAAPGAHGVVVAGVRWPDKLECTLLGDDDELRLPLSLVTRAAMDGQPTSAFYVMDHKVSQKQFAEFLKEHPATGPAGGNGAAVSRGPQLNVNGIEAGKFACWLDAKSASDKWVWNLPTADEWDLAAGRTPAGTKNPLASAGAPMDNASVLRDTAEGVREWTRTTDEPAGPEFSKCDPDVNLFLFMRGEENRAMLTNVQDNYPDVGFRLVVEVQPAR